MITFTVFYMKLINELIELVKVCVISDTAYFPWYMVEAKRDLENIDNLAMYKTDWLYQNLTVTAKSQSSVRHTYLMALKKSYVLDSSQSWPLPELPGCPGNPSRPGPPVPPGGPGKPGKR